MFQWNTSRISKVVRAYPHTFVSNPSIIWWGEGGSGRGKPKQFIYKRQLNWNKQRQATKTTQTTCESSNSLPDWGLKMGWCSPLGSPAASSTIAAGCASFPSTAQHGSLSDVCKLPSFIHQAHKLSSVLGTNNILLMPEQANSSFFILVPFFVDIFPTHLSMLIEHSGCWNQAFVSMWHKFQGAWDWDWDCLV